MLSIPSKKKQRTHTINSKVDKYSGPTSSQASSVFALGTWHGPAGPPEAALADIADRCPHLLPLARFLLPRLPRALLCSNNLKTEKASSFYMSMNRAVRRKWMGMQTREQKRINALVVDCDGPNWRAELDALIVRGLCPPSFIVRSPVRTKGNRRTGHVTQDRAHETAHLYWVLAFPIKKENAKAYDLFTRTRAGLIRLLGADPAAAGHLGKNPFHGDYITEVGPLQAVELLDLCRPMQAWCEEGEYFLPERTVSRDGGPRYLPGAMRVAAEATPLTNDEASQWGKLFEARHGIYAARTRDYALILSMVEEHAGAVGSRGTPQDMRHTARSIHRFMVRTFAGAGKRPDIDHGVMTREHVERGDREGWVAMDKKAKRAEAARRTNEMRMRTTRSAVTDAATRLWAGGELITQEALAMAAEVSERTVRRLWDDPEILAGIGFTPVRRQPDTRSYQGFTQQGTEGVGAGQPEALTLAALATASRERASVVKAEVAKRARTALVEERRDLGLARPWRKLAQAILKSGAMPRPVPPCPAGSPAAVRMAFADALVAHRDARRRFQARRDKAAAMAQVKQRRQDFTAWAKAGDVASFQAWMAAEETRWGWVEQSVESEPRHVRTRKFVQRAVHFKRCWSEWNTALTVARHRDDVAYWQAVRQREQPVLVAEPVQVPPTQEEPLAVSTLPAGILMPSFIRSNMAARHAVPDCARAVPYLDVV